MKYANYPLAVSICCSAGVMLVAVIAAISGEYTIAGVYTFVSYYMIVIGLIAKGKYVNDHKDDA